MDNGKYGTDDGLSLVYDTVIQPNKLFSVYIYGQNGKYGYHIKYGHKDKRAREPISLETSGLIYDTVFFDSDNIIMKQEGKYRFKSILMTSEGNLQWNIPYIHYVRHRPNDLSDWYDDISTKTIQPTKKFKGTLLLRKGNLYGLFTLYKKGGDELELGKTLPCIWDSIEPAFDGFIFYVWKNGKLGYFSVLSEKVVGVGLNKNELSRYWSSGAYVTESNNIPITLYRYATLDSLFTIRSKDNAFLIRDTTYNYTISPISLMREVSLTDFPYRYARILVSLKSYNLTNEFPFGTLKNSLLSKYKEYMFCQQIHSYNRKDDTFQYTLNQNGWIYQLQTSSNSIGFQPVIGYDFTKENPNDVPVTVYSSYDGEIVKTFNLPGYYVQYKDGEIIAIKIDNLQDSDTGEIKIDVNTLYNHVYFGNEKRNLKKKILGYYVFDTKTKSYKISSKRVTNNNDDELWYQ